MDRGELERLIDLGLTQRELAEALQCSQTTVRYWLRRWGLRTAPTEDAIEAREARAAGVTSLERECKEHGRTRFTLATDGVYRCAKCRAANVAQRRRRVKAILVAEAGGRCVLCGFDRHPSALQFHHVRPESKRFGVGAGGLTRGIEKLRAEARKCVLVCANCHAMLEVGFLALSPDAALGRG